MRITVGTHPSVSSKSLGHVSAVLFHPLLDLHLPTGNAMTATVAKVEVISIQDMAIQAVSFTGIDGSNRVASKVVFLLGDGFKVERVHARPISAEVIYGQVAWNGSAKSAVCKSVSANELPDVKDPVAVIANKSCPIPTRRAIPSWTILVNFFQKALNYLRIQTGKRSLFLQVHVIAASNGCPTLPILPPHPELAL